MGILNFLFSKDNSSKENTEKEFDRRKISAEKIDNDQRIEARESYKRKIYKKFYSDYPEKPFISKDREENTNWIEQAEMFPKQSIIPKSMMKRYKDGLLPGHVYMLYSIDKIHRKRIPAYFEYDYGIDFFKEREFLVKNGYLDTNYKLTGKGMIALGEHKNVINERNPQPQKIGNNNDSVQIASCGRFIDILPQGRSHIPPKDYPIIIAEIQEVNKIVLLAKKLANLSADLSINTSNLDFNEMYYDFQDLTPSGRKTKSPLTLYYVCYGHNEANPVEDYFGEIGYSREGFISSGRFVFWKRKNGFMINIGTEKNKVIIKKVQISKDFKWIVKYKHEK